MHRYEPRFICDDHCGRLARWLRFLGFDCVHGQDFDDSAVLRVSLDEGRVILTRDHALADRSMARSVILLESEQPLEQLRQVIGVCALSVADERMGTVCSVCNTVTAPVEKSAIADRLPPYVRATQHEFRECPQCRRLYWRATHVARMRERLREAGILPRNSASS